MSVGRESTRADAPASIGGPEPRAAPSLLVPFVLVATAALVLGLSYTLPTVTFRTIASREAEVYSIWGGIVSLWRDGNVVLAPVVFLFSIVFPVAKLVLLGWVIAEARRQADRAPVGIRRSPRALVEWLRLLGKWSMLDVLIIALFVGSIRIGLATASSLAGIHVFTAAIVLSMLASASLARSLGSTGGHDERAAAVVPRAPVQRWVGRLVSLACAVSIAAALSQPLLVVSKAFFFSNEVALWGTARAMVADGERGLGVILLLCVGLLPTLRSLVSCALWWGPARAPRVARLARALDEWAMLEVLALALAIVHVKLEELASTRLLFGFWMVYVAGALTALDAWLSRRHAQSAPGLASRPCSDAGHAAP